MKNKLVIVGDDIRETTGVANVLKQIILFLAKDYECVQYACGSRYEQQNIIDISESVSNIVGISNCNVRLHETKAFGNKEEFRKLLLTETPSAVFIMTDPHRYDYLFEMEHEIRTMCPLLYYHVWDNDPVPNFLKSVYDSCDWVGCISKLTYENIKQLCPSHSGIEHIPHGVNLDIYQKQSDEQIIQNRNDFLGRDYKFVLLCNNANTRRKNIASLIEGFSLFYRNLKKEEQSDVTLLIHTDPTSPNGLTSIAY